MYTTVSMVVVALAGSCQQVAGFVPAGLVPSAAVTRTTRLTMAVNDQLPANAKRYYVRPDRILDVVTSAPQLLFRLGSGALVDGYNCECVFFGGKQSCVTSSETCTHPLLVDPARSLSLGLTA